MSVVNILLTDPAVEGYEPFAHDGNTYRFSKLGPDGPATLLDGQVWAFVDWLLDDLAGLEMCRRLRTDPRTASAHVTMVLEEDNHDFRKRALEAGADDYMLGPLNRARALDRILALADRVHSSLPESDIIHGSLEIKLSAIRAYWDGAPIDLMPNEFRLLRFLAENRNQVLTREQLITGLGKGNQPIDARTVDVWVGRLRRAIRAAGGGNPLRTVRSVGYVFDLR